MIHVLFVPLLFFLAFFPLYRQISVTPPDRQYSWAHGRISDYYSYLSYIRQGMRQWHQTNQYSTEDTAPKWTHLFYLLLGKVGSVVTHDPILLYYIAMGVCLFLFYGTTYYLVHLIFSGGWRILALFLIFFASPFPSYRISFFGKEIFLGTASWTHMDSYSRLTMIPHHYIGLTLFLFASIGLVHYRKNGRRVWGILAAVTNAVGTIFFAIPGFIFSVALGIICVFDIFLKKRIRIGMIGIFVTALVAQGIIYGIYKMGQTVWFDALEWEYSVHKMEVFPATFSLFLLSYGPLLFLAPFSVFRILKEKKFETRYVALVAGLPILLYQASLAGLPVNKLRFVYSAPYVFWGILATLGIQTLFQRFASRRIKTFFLGSLLGLLLLGTIAGLRAYWLPFTRVSTLYKNTYIPKDYLKALTFLEETVPVYTPIMTTWFSGVYIPAYSSLKVFIGHEVSTMHIEEKWKITENFFSGALRGEEAKNLLTTHTLSYVLWDSDHVGPLHKPYASFLQPVFSSGNVVVYRVGNN